MGSAMKILARLISGLGRLLLGSAMVLAFCALALAGIASYLVSWPYRKLYSPREASFRLTMDAVTVLSAAWHLRAEAARRDAAAAGESAQAGPGPRDTEPVEPRG